MNTTEPIVFSRARDVLWRDVSLDHQTELRVFGIRVRLESNSAYTVDRFNEALGRHHSYADAAAGSVDSRQAPVRLRVVLEPSRTELSGLQQVQWRFPDADHALLRVPGMCGLLDLAAFEGIIYVEEDYARVRAVFDDTSLRAPVLTLVTRRDRHPVHAAALRRGDAALLLCGPSGVGKSTTCYVASRVGIDVLSDDSIRVQLDPELRIWGLPGRVHLLGDAAARFAPVTSGGMLRSTPNGKVKHVVDVPHTEPRPPFVHRARVCLLQRGPGPATCTPASPDEIVHAIVSAPEAQSDFYPQGRLPAVEALAAPGGWTLTLSDDAEETLPHLEAMMALL